LARAAVWLWNKEVSGLGPEVAVPLAADQPGVAQSDA
jgi:hypothetical protein